MITKCKRTTTWYLTGLICSTLMVGEISCSDEIRNDNKTDSPALFAYKPPKRGAPKARAGGGTRALASSVQVLAPNHLGFTSQEQPSLYWYLQPEAYKSKLQKFELTDANTGEFLFTQQLPIPQEYGIQHIDLTKFDVNLKPDVIYTWQVTVINAKRHTSKSISNGSIKFIGSNSELADVTLQRKPYLAAELGLWYDALDWVSKLIDTQSDSKYWQLQRADLLEQGGLRSIAMFERQQLSDIK
jgi:hypothetical protein